MAVSTIAGDFDGGIRITCILNEGAPTVGSRVYDNTGGRVTGLTWATEIQKEDVVALDRDTANTYAATGGLPVVTKPSNGEAYVVGKVVTEPEIVQFPANTAAGDSWSKQLAGKYYRIATVEFWPFVAIKPATIVGANAAAVTIGTTGLLEMDISESYTNHGLCVFDVGSGGTGLVSLHYHPKGTTTATILVGILGFITSAT